MRDKVVSSSYWFLINSNLNVHNPNPENQKKIKEFREAINRIFLSRNILNFISIIDEADVKIPKPDLLNEIRAEITFEIGSKNGLLHCHCAVTIYHKTTIKFNATDIMKYVRQEYGFSIYVSPARIVADYSVQIKRYQYKEMKKIPRLKINDVVIDENGQPKNFFYSY